MEPFALLPSPSTKLQRDPSHPQKERLMEREESALPLLPVTSFQLLHLPNRPPPPYDRDLLSPAPSRAL